MAPTVNANPAPDTGCTVASVLRGNDLPRLECSLLLAHVLGTTRESVLAYPETILNNESTAEFVRLKERRLAGGPIAYLLGWREFYGLRLRITPDVLIPRPDTELLVDAALHLLPASVQGRVLDLGTGSGAVAIAIARQRPHVQVDA